MLRCSAALTGVMWGCDMIYEAFSLTTMACFRCVLSLPLWHVRQRHKGGLQQEHSRHATRMESP